MFTPVTSSDDYTWIYPPAIHFKKPTTLASSSPLIALHNPILPVSSVISKIFRKISLITDDVQHLDHNSLDEVTCVFQRHCALYKIKNFESSLIKTIDLKAILDPLNSLFSSLALYAQDQPVPSSANKKIDARIKSFKKWINLKSIDLKHLKPLDTFQSYQYWDLVRVNQRPWCIWTSVNSRNIQSISELPLCLSSADACPISR